MRPLWKPVGQRGVTVGPSNGTAGCLPVPSEHMWPFARTLRRCQPQHYARQPKGGNRPNAHRLVDGFQALLLGSKKGRGPHGRCNVQGSQKIMVLGERSQTQKAQIVGFHVCESSRGQVHGGRKEIGGFQGLGEGRMGVLKCLKLVVMVARTTL